MIVDDRDDIRLSVRCRAKSGAVADLDVLDISAGGCMVAAKGWDAEPGERVLTTLHGLGVQQSYLVWLEDGRAGIAFEQPLHTAVYDYLRSWLEGGVVREREDAERAAAEVAAKAKGPRRKLY